MAIDTNVVGRRPGLMLGPPFDRVGDAIAQPADRPSSIVLLYLDHGRLLRCGDPPNMDIPSISPIVYEPTQIR
jgi:hypothetical protein